MRRTMGAAVGLLLAQPGRLTVGIEGPQGWIQPVRALSLKAKKATQQHMLATVIYPQTEQKSWPSRVTARKRGDRFLVVVGSDRIEFRGSSQGWKLEKVTSGE